ncbi:MAG: T9SS type A sorting domain-containing protein [Bacteroidota bacterium]|nr:T9SS type A sorting domain-containing protein [Bacteroidota bacterium]
MTNRLHKFLILIALFISTKNLVAQEYVVDYTFLGSRTKFELLVLFGQLVDYDIDLYKIRYKTLDINMQPDTASGLLVLPQVPSDTQLPIVVYGHGTTSGPTDVPSQLRGGFEVAMAYAGKGFATAAPDYLGLGDSRGFHPYVHAASEASASLDMLFATYEFLELNDPDYDPNFLFLSGYSQGGHASMALHKEIEDFWSIIIPVTAATHMSGPYSLSGVMRDKILSDESYNSPAYIAYIFLGYNEVYNLYNDVSEVFKEPYATSIESFYNGNINLTMLNATLITQLNAGGDTIVKRMLQDSIVEALANDINHPLNIALQENDTYNFAPTSPTKLYYCGGDITVSPANSLVAEAEMNALGAIDLEAVDLNSGLTHGACVFPAVLSSIDFFLSFVNGTGIEDLDKNADQLTVYPNPAFDEITVRWNEASAGMDYLIIDAKGVTVSQGHSSSDRISVSGLTSGLYTVICTAGRTTRVARILRP